MGGLSDLGEMIKKADHVCVFSGYSSDSIHGGGGGGGVVPARPWSSTDSGSLDVPGIGPSLSQRAALLSMQKAGSFGGVPSMYRDKLMPRLGSMGNLSSLQEDDENGHEQRMVLDASKQPERQPSIPEGAAIMTHPPAPHGQHGQHVIFAVNGWEHVPPGALVYNPQTGILLLLLLL